MYYNLEQFFKRCRKIYFTGPMGSGKSTIIDNIIDYNKFVKIPEYIIGLDNGKELFDDMIKNKISKFVFQFNILKYYDEYLVKIYKQYCNENRIITLVFDRYPLDTVENFSTYFYLNKQLTLKEFNILKQYCDYINTKYNLLNDINHIHKVKIINNNLDKSIRKIDKLINSSCSNILFIITNNSDILISRIVERNRSNEVKNINYENILFQINYYNKC